ncbi:MAG: hypothetical protein EDX89_24185 [Acidobacteria bacterium]|nr:MAG: hypothetical protein EDX89_24185 [Acidobacteriota bacterium]
MRVSPALPGSHGRSARVVARPLSGILRWVRSTEEANLNRAELPESTRRHDAFASWLFRTLGGRRHSHRPADREGTP